MRLSLPPFPRVNSRRWRSQTFLTLYISRSWWDPLRTKKPSEKLLPKTENFPKNFQCLPQLSIHQISYISYMEWLKNVTVFPKSPLKNTENTWIYVSILLTTYEGTFPTPLVVWALGSRISCHVVRRAPSSPTGASVKRGDIQKTNPSMMPVSTKNNVKKVKENDEFNESQASLNFKTLQAGNCKFGQDFLAKTTFLGWRDLTSLILTSLLLYRRPAVIFQATLSHHLRFT